MRAPHLRFPAETAESLDDEVFKDSYAHQDIELYGNRLRTLSWMMRCVANDPTYKPPKGIDVHDAIELTMEVLDMRAAELDELAERVRRHLNRVAPPKPLPPEAFLRRRTDTAITEGMCVLKEEDAESDTSPEAHAFRERRSVAAQAK